MEMKFECGCKTHYTGYWPSIIELCPLHKAAPKMLAKLKELSENIEQAGVDNGAWWLDSALDPDDTLDSIITEAEGKA